MQKTLIKYSRKHIIIFFKKKEIEELALEPGMTIELTKEMFKNTSNN